MTPSTTAGYTPALSNPETGYCRFNVDGVRD